uniref:non-specific lipid transfer protein GPI-anchored 31-like n=1 Tax=Erigeron canadensis TaxID=72917 RepID=UPI001CB96AA6|nr:non-specific lipid transfer protein GPI-anchored 31-like [Erigeron canadensis]
MAQTNNNLVITIITIMFSAALIQSAHHSGAPAPAADCSTVILNMADCLSFVTAGSTVVKPEGTCCSGLKSVLKTDAECLCEAFKNSAQLGIQLNVTKAMSLPSACKVKAPSVSNCGMSLGTGTAPVQSPMAMGMAPGMAFGPSMAAAPTPASQNSGSNGLAMSYVSVFLSMLLSVYFYSY